LLVQNASYGQPIARCWGQVALAFGADGVLS
jgi:hypothetical protein